VGFDDGVPFPDIVELNYSEVNISEFSREATCPGTPLRPSGAFGGRMFVPLTNEHVTPANHGK